MYALHKAMRKHGVNNFSMEIVVEASVEDLDRLERYYIETLGTFGEYNMTTGGEAGSREYTQEYRDRTSARLKRYWQDMSKREKQSTTIAATYTKDLRDSQGQTLREYWESSEGRKRREEGLGFNSDKSLAKRRKIWESEDFRNRAKTTTENLWKDPEYQQTQFLARINGIAVFYENTVTGEVYAGNASLKAAGIPEGRHIWRRKESGKIVERGYKDSFEYDGAVYSRITKERFLEKYKEKKI